MSAGSDSPRSCPILVSVVPVVCDIGSGSSGGFVSAVWFLVALRKVNGEQGNQGTRNQEIKKDKAFLPVEQKLSLLSLFNTKTFGILLCCHTRKYSCMFIQPLSKIM